MSETYTIHPAMTVILTDFSQAVLFTAWTERDIDDELEEHFPDGNATIYLCPRLGAEQALAGWPRYPEPLPSLRHVVPFGTVAHILEANNEQIGRVQDGATDQP
jgi:hypothetical protein